MAKVFWDTNLFIYLLEGGPLMTVVEAILNRMVDRGDRLYTSTLTVGEVLVRPWQTGARALEQQYLDWFRSPEITIIPFDLRTASKYAQIRRKTISPPDAIQLACAATAEVDLFLTNDDRLSKVTTPEIKFVASLARSPI